MGCNSSKTETSGQNKPEDKPADKPSEEEPAQNGGTGEGKHIFMAFSTLIHHDCDWLLNFLSLFYNCFTCNAYY